MEKRQFRHRQVALFDERFRGTGYYGRLVGNSPELMPQDNNLFADMKRALDWNVAATSDLPTDHPDKFDKSTPKRLRKAVIRTWQYSPSSDRIVEDIDRGARAVGEIIVAEGHPIKFQGQRRGKRAGRDGPEVGPKRRRTKLDVTSSIGQQGHPLARVAVAQQIGTPLAPVMDTYPVDPYLIADLTDDEDDDNEHNDDDCSSCSEDEYDEAQVTAALDTLLTDDDLYLPSGLEAQVQARVASSYTRRSRATTRAATATPTATAAAAATTAVSLLQPHVDLDCL